MVRNTSTFIYKQVRIPLPYWNEILSLWCEKSNDQHQFDLLYVSHNAFRGSSCKYILTGGEVASRYKVVRTMRTKAFVLEAIYEKCSVFKYLKVLQFDNGSKFENNGTKFLEKHYVDVGRAAIKYKHTHSAFVETFNKKLAR